MLIVEIDVVSPQTPQAAFHRTSDLGRFAIHSTSKLSCLLVDVPTEFGGNFHPMAHAGEGFADHFFICPWAIDFRSVKKVDTLINGLAKEGNHILPIFNLLRLSVTHGAEGKRGDFEALA